MCARLGVEGLEPPRETTLAKNLPSIPYVKTRLFLLASCLFSGCTEVGAKSPKCMKSGQGMNGGC